MNTEVKGPSEAALAASAGAKEQGYEPLYVKIAGKEFVYRFVERSEWRTLLKARNEAMAQAIDDQAKLEVAEKEIESLLEVCLIYSTDPIEKLPAGTVQLISDAILVASGFGGLDAEPVKL